ncbi:Eukaryotic translation initiation factor 4 gamma 3 Short=eIF-4-gamma 3 [Rhizoctonia solani AG-1 IB]|uniref:Eukaryotic translation initiation factor 4 gamma 3 Short=eIF-4-gamma 3 n=1 Tax=Thanatephorus cucumeris (strain AG1-IB / isolate 7/3/14) TaxID=1108050 RepID=M5C7B8_THACB|nr:Eukaryotic translation initiation factor 4 gamma 3 Short=eIF-4-gamma 3 [Rhizoctonia solani AG-1 IB]
MQVIKLIFEKAKDEVAFSEAYARLCRKMMEQISPNIQDETIRNPQNQLITGGMLLRRCLLDLCQGEFEHVWSAKEASLTPAPLKVGGKDVKIATVENDRLDSSGKYHAADKAKRQSLGLVRFIGELFKLQMLTERVIHYCIQRLLEAEEIESLCELLTTVGQSLDNPKAKNHIDIYFERMQEMVMSSNINSRMQFMLQDVIELRSRRWQAHSAVSLPAPAHQDSSRDGSGRHGVSRGGSRRGGHHGASAAEPELWNVASGAGANRPAARAGGLSQFDKISKPTGIQFGSSSLFSKKDANKRDSSIGCTGGTNTLSALISGVPGGPSPSTALTTSNRKLSIDLGSGVSPAAAGTGKRKKLNLLPRIKPTEFETDKGDDKEKGEATLADLTEEEAQNKVKEDIKEYLGVENIDDAIMALEALPSEHRHLFVDGLVDASMDGGNKVVVLAEKLFSAAQSRLVISPGGFERGLLPTIEMADWSIDVPKIYEWLARMIHAAGLDKAKAEEMAGKISACGESRVPPRELLLKEFEKASSA